MAYVAEFEPTDHVGLHLQTDLIIICVYCGPGLVRFSALHFAAPNLVLQFLESSVFPYAFIKYFNIIIII